MTEQVQWYEDTELYRITQQEARAIDRRRRRLRWQRRLEAILLFAPLILAVLIAAAAIAVAVCIGG